MPVKIGSVSEEWGTCVVGEAFGEKRETERKVGTALELASGHLSSHWWFRGRHVSDGFSPAWFYFVTFEWGLDPCNDWMQLECIFIWIIVYDTVQCCETEPRQTSQLILKHPSPLPILHRHAEEEMGRDRYVIQQSRYSGTIFETEQQSCDIYRQ